MIRNIYQRIEVARDYHFLAKPNYDFDRRPVSLLDVRLLGYSSDISRPHGYGIGWEQALAGPPPRQKGLGRQAKTG